MSRDALRDLAEAGREPIHRIDGLDCCIEIASRPAYCNRGNFIATIDHLPKADLRRLSLDGADGWPRYYFDLGRAKLEAEDWLRKRRQWRGGRWRETVVPTGGPVPLSELGK